MNIKLLSEDHLEFLSLKGGCTGLSESAHVKMPHCWKFHVAAHLVTISSRRVNAHDFKAFSQCMAHFVMLLY